MARVDFYVLDDPAPAAARVFACRLIEKAWRAGHRIFVFTETSGDTQTLDQLLWTYRQESFLPHETLGRKAEVGETPCPILIGHAEAVPEPLPDVLVNLSGDVPATYQRFQRVAEIVSGDPAAREAGRARFRAYRERGDELHSHQI